MKLFIILFLFSTQVFASLREEINATLNNGDIDAAKKLVAEMSQQDDEYALKDFFEAQILFSANDYESAQKSIEKALKRAPDAEVYHLAGGIYGMRAATSGIFSKLGFAKKSKKNLLKAYQLEPSNKDYIIGLLQFNIQAPGLAGGDSDQIEPLLNELARIDANKAIEIRTNYLAEEEGFEEALVYIDSELAKQPYSVDLKFYKAFLFETEEKNEQAMVAYSDVIALKPEESERQGFENWSRALYRFGRLASISKKQLAKGRNHFLTFLALNSTKGSGFEPWAHYRLGLIYQHMSDENNAQASFDQAKSLNPNQNLMKLLKKT